jgi:beta-galactosidase
MYLPTSLLLTATLLVSTVLTAAPVNFSQEWQLKDAYRERSTTRQKTCLNGRWKIRLLNAKELQIATTIASAKNSNPAKKLSIKEQMLQNMKRLNKKAPAQKQKYPAVLTLSAANSSLYIYTPGVFYNPSGRQTGLLGTGLINNRRVGWQATRNLTYNGKNIKTYPGAIYQRDIAIANPNKNYFIRLDNVKDQALVYVNGKFAGVSEGREANDIAVSKLLKLGNNRLQIVVTPDNIKAKPQLRGLIGDIWLIKRPTTQFIKYAFLETADFSNKQLVLKLALQGKPQGKFAVTLKLKGKNITIPVKLTPQPQKSKTDQWVTATFDFPQVAIWSPEQPNLYKCTVKWQQNDKIIDETIPFNFGFREIKVKGKNYIFNNHKFHFRNFAGSSYLSHIEAKSYRKDFAEFKKAGINSISLWNPESPENILALADEYGILVNIYLYGIKPNVYTWNNSKTRNRVKKQLTEYLKATQNHPSVVHYFIDPGLLAYAQDISPYGIAHDNLLPKEDYDGNHAQAGPAAEYGKWLKAFDPHKAVLQYAGGAHGDIYSTMIYLNFVRLQDKKEWLNGWSKIGTKPFYAIEMGMPWDSSYYHDHISGTTKPRTTEPMIAEYSAIDIGEKVYAMDNKTWYRKQFACKVKPQAQNGNDFYIGGSSLFYQYWRAGRPDNILLHEQLLFSETIRAWRYNGISGFTPWAYLEMIADDDNRRESAIPEKYSSYKTPGAKPFFQVNSRLKRYNDNYKPLTASMADRLIFIADKDTLRADHTYYDNELITKKIVFINDGAKVNPTFTINVTEPATGKTVFSKHLKMSCPRGETVEQQFSFKAPKLQQRASYKITVTGTIAGKKYNDHFMIEVLPTPKKLAKLKRKFYLYNPAATTALPEQLKTLGIVCDAYNPGIALKSPTDVLIIARNSLPKLTKNITQITDFVNQGGTVLVMEQQAKVLKDIFKLKTLRLNSRTLFKAFDKTELLKELKAVDLKNWRGDSNFLPLDNTWLKHGYPRHIWTISQTGVVSSLLIQRPHTGAYRSYLNGGFDLDYSALLELTIGRGRIFFCQLDISSRNSSNPNSMLALSTLVKAIDERTPQTKPQPIVYSGNSPQVIKLIKTLKIKSATETSAPNSVMLVGPRASKAELKKAQQHLQNSGTVIFMANKLLALLPKQFKAPTSIKLDDYTLNQFPKLPLLSGITLADFYWKDYYRYPIFKIDGVATPITAVKALNGTVVFCQVDPYVFSETPTIQRQQRSQQKKLRIIANLMNNLGVAFESPTNSSVKRFDGILMEDKWGFKIDPQNRGEKLAYTKGFKATHKLSPAKGWEAQGITNKNSYFTPPKNRKDYDGIAWYQQAVIIPLSAKGKKIYFRAQVDDYDITWFNGVEIGRTGRENKHAYREYRKYLIPEKLIKYGAKNRVIVKVDDIGFDGGFWIDRRMKIKIGIFPDKTNEGPYHDASYDYDPYLFRRW